MRQLKITKSITNRESASFEKYLQEIGKEELITAQEEVVLARLIRQGDQRALEKLVRANLRFVVSVAKQYQTQGLSLPDLINQLGAANKVKKAFSELEQKFEREPSAEELSAILDLPMDKVTNTMKMPGKHVSMDAPLVSGEDSTLLDVLENGDSLGADSGLLNESLQKEINRSLATLSEREQDVIKMFYGIGIQHGLSLEEIGEKFDLTSERVRQIKEKAIKTLRQNSRNKLLKAYLG